MIGWLIFAGIVLLISIAMTLFLTFELNVESQADFKLRYAIFSIFPRKKKKKVKKTKKNSKKLKRKEEKKDSEKADKPRIKKKLDLLMIKAIIDSFGKSMQKLVKKIKINEIYIDSVVGGKDAAMVAINYGLHNTAIHSFLIWLDKLMIITVKEVNIEADFDKEKSDFFLHCKIKIRTSTLVLCIFTFLKHFIANNMRNKKEERKQKNG